MRTIPPATRKQIRFILETHSKDWIEVVRGIGRDPRYFFEGGYWYRADFTASDMRGVSWKGAIVDEATFARGFVDETALEEAASSRQIEFIDAEAHPGGPSGGRTSITAIERYEIGEKDGQSVENTSPDLEEDLPLGQPRPQLPELDPEELIAQVLDYNPKSNADKIREAFYYGMKMHEGQFRQSGEPYFTHPVAVAHVLAEQRLDDATIITALLHDTIRDTEATTQEIETRFDHHVAELVAGVWRLTNLQLSSAASQQAENFRGMFMAMSKDLRVILVKIADRLHNMRTIRHMRAEKQVQKSRETMDIYAPLAGRMGMQWVREELEDLAFHVLNPDARASIIRRFIRLQRESGDVNKKITTDIRKELDKAGIEADVFGRAKKPYSIWRKMQEKDQPFSRLPDIYVFKIITTSEQDCYRAQGVVHQRWRAVPGRFKDYISQPKSNGYRGIHTAVSGRDGKRVQVQIRTREMHEVAEAGIAANFSYRDGARTENVFTVDPAKWLADLTERFSSDDGDFLEHVTLEMHSDLLYCFTPKGEVVKLPRGATPLDFAYAIHTQVGNSCVGATVDGIRVPLWTRIKNGQSVEIILAEGQSPQAKWLDIVVTGRAKSAIRRRLREEDRERYIRLGRELARVAFEHVGRVSTAKALSVAAKRFSLPDGDELLARIGSAELSAKEVVKTLYRERIEKEGGEIDGSHAIVGLGPGENFQIAQCCHPVPGERIVGISYRGKGVVVHAIDCHALEEVAEESARWVDVQWHSSKHKAMHTVSLDVSFSHGSGGLGRVTGLIEELGAIVSNLMFVDRKPDVYRMIVDVDLRDLEHLHAVMSAVEADSDVIALSRHRDLARAP